MNEKARLGGSKRYAVADEVADEVANDPANAKIIDYRELSNEKVIEEKEQIIRQERQSSRWV